MKSWPGATRPQSASSRIQLSQRGMPLVAIGTANGHPISQNLTTTLCRALVFFGAAREYEVEGKASLSDDWGPTNASSRFFRVKVSLPE